MSDSTTAVRPQPLPIPADFPVQWEQSSDQSLTWTRDRMHFPDQMTMLAAELVRLAWAGMELANVRFGIPVAPLARRINTYHYQAELLTVSPQEMAAQEAKAEAAVKEAVAALLQTWENETLPEVKAHLAYWEGFDLAGAAWPQLIAHFDETVRRTVRVWELHFRTV